MNDIATALVGAAITIAVLMLATWWVSLARKDASIVDVVWGLGFVVVAWVVRLLVDGNPARQWLLVALTTIWGVRLAGYIGWRNHGKGEDYRYKAMRQKYGDRFGVVSLVRVFALQGVLMWIVSLPVQLGQVRDTRVGWLAVLGVIVYAVGLFFEAVGDFQLAAFKGDPANEGKVMDRGLWRYTRHPNYFGDACIWWGLALIAAETGVGSWGIVGAIVMTILLRRVSGVTLLERSLKRRRPGYEEYVARTSPFIPMPPKSS